MRVTRLLLILMLCAGIDVAQGAHGQCSVTDRYRPSYKSYWHNATSSGKRERMTLIGLFPIHTKRDSSCGEILTAKYYNGFQRAMAMTYGLDVVNQDPNKRYAIDGVLFDTCSNGIASIETILEFMRSHGRSNILGVVGASYSSVTEEVSTVLQTFNISMLSYAATSTELSKKKRHPLFARLLPSDDRQAQVVLDLATETLNWTTVDVLVSAEAAYSKSLKERLSDLISENKRNLTLCSIQEFERDVKNASNTNVAKLVSDIRRSRVDGFISFLTADDKRELITEIGRKYRNQTFHLKVIGTDSWDTTELNDHDAAYALVGRSYVIIPDSSAGESLFGKRSLTSELFSEISPRKQRKRNNPWIEEVWNSAKMFNCSTPKICENKGWDWSRLKMDSKVDFAFDSVLAFSDALERCKRDEGKGGGLCDVQSQRFFNSYILTTNLTDGQDSGNDIRFDCEGNRDGRYGIYKLEGSPRDVGTEYVKIGYWADGAIKVKASEVEKLAVSNCTPECRKNEYKDMDENDCCYECKNLTMRHVKLSAGGQRDCGDGSWPDVDLTGCDTLEVKKLNPSNPLSIFALGLASFGIILQLAFATFGFYYREHKVIKSCGRELGVMIAIGVMINHLNTFFLFFSEPTPSLCGFLRFSATIGLTTILASILLKTNRIFRIFYTQFRRGSESTTPLGQVNYTSPGYQILFCLGLVMIQCFVVLLWITIDSPEVEDVYCIKRHVKVCKANAFHMSLAEVYNVILAIVATLYAFLVRNVDSNFSESKWISYAMYSVCVSWMIDGVLLVFAVGEKADAILDHKPEKNFALACIANSSQALLVMMFLFAHRVYKVYQESNKVKERDNPEGDEAKHPSIIRMSIKRSNSIIPKDL